MTHTDISPTEQQPTRQAIEAKGRSAPGKVTGKVKRALDLMVWKGSRRDVAAEEAGLSIHGLREALRRPHVKAYYNEQCEVLRTSGRARRIHRLEELSEQDDNKAAAVNATLALDRIEDQQVAASRQQVPGFILVIGSTADVKPGVLMGQQRVIDVKPLIQHETGSDAPTALPDQGSADD
jgi:hypothetical protein